MAEVALVGADKRGWSAAQRKLDSHLIYAARAARGLAAVPGLHELPDVLARAHVDRQGIVTVDIQAHVDGALLDALRRLGAQILSSFPAYDAVRAQLPITAIETAAGLPAIRSIRRALPPLLNRAGSSASASTPFPASVTSVAPVASPAAGAGAALPAASAAAITNTIVQTQGNHAHAADIVHNLGITGAGIKVGVMSDGVDSLALQQAAMALPAVTVLSGQAGSGDEGTAILEIVHTLAPGAQLYFATAFQTDAQMATNIAALQAAGCDVIIDDVTYLDEGVFQDSAIAQAVNAATAAGVLFFSSAANAGNGFSGTSGTWEGDFAPSAVTGASGTFHDFGGGTTMNPITASSPNGAILEWSDPLGAATDDYDLYVFDSSNHIVEMSTTRQTGAQDPYESVDPPVKAGGYLAVALYSGSPRALHLQTIGGMLHINSTGATFGHNAAGSAVSVAATNVANAAGSKFLGGAQDPVEPYSSDGFRRIFFSPDGAALTAGNLLFATGGGTLLAKPDVTAADCVANNTPSFAVFCGTSAAAPHAGAIAALALSMPNHPTPSQVRAAMLSSALDDMTAGLDLDSGNGVVMADRLVAALTPAPIAVQFYTVTPCRLVDTRNAAGTLGGPALQPNATRPFPLTGACGIPSTALAISVNLTVTQATSGGDLRVYPADLTSPPLVSSINFAAGQTLANNAVLKLGAGASAGTANVLLDSAGSVQLIVDVNGYFE